MSFHYKSESKRELDKKRGEFKLEQARLKNLLQKHDSFAFYVGEKDEEGPQQPLKYVGGVDISFYKNTDKALACLVVLEYPSLKKVAEYYEPCVMTEPYMPGFLAFRENPHLMKVVNQFLSQYPHAKDQMIILVDGNGILHYRGFGLASHFGVTIDIPTIGVGKELLVCDGLDKESVLRNCYKQLTNFGDSYGLVGPHTGRVLGAAFRSTSKIEPLYISIGHRISLETALYVVKQCCKPGQFLPEPVRLADGLSRDVISARSYDELVHEKKRLSVASQEIEPSLSSLGLPSSFGSKPQVQEKTTAPSSETRFSANPWKTVPAQSQPEEKNGSLDQTSSAPKRSKTETQASEEKRWTCPCGESNPDVTKHCLYCYHVRDSEKLFS